MDGSSDQGNRRTRGRDPVARSPIWNERFIVSMLIGWTVTIGRRRLRQRRDAVELNRGKDFGSNDRP